MKLIRNVTWIFGANLVVSLSKWLILVIIARVLTPEHVGAYSLSLAIGAPITLFANMKLRSLYITGEKNDFYNYLFSRNMLSVFALIVLFIISITFYPDYFYIIILVGIIKILELQSDMFYSLPHKKEDMNIIGKLMIGKHLISLTVFFISMIITYNLILSLVTQIVSQCIWIYFMERKQTIGKYNLLKTDINLHNIKIIIKMGLPLGLVQMMFSFNASYPRYLLEYFESAEILGYFSAIAYILTIGNMMMNAVSQNFLPGLARNIKLRDYKSFNKNVYFKLTTFSLILGLGLIVFSLILGQTFLNFFYGIEYTNYVDILILMSFALAINFVSWNFDTALLAMRYISIQPKISVTVLVINLVLGYFLISRYGIFGATYTIIITNSIQLVLRVVFVTLRVKHLKKHDNIIKNLGV